MNYGTRTGLSSSNRIEVRHLYTGRAIKNERELISSQVDFNGYVISAGAGLLLLSMIRYHPTKLHSLRMMAPIIKMEYIAEWGLEEFTK